MLIIVIIIAVIYLILEFIFYQPYSSHQYKNN